MITVADRSALLVDAGDLLAADALVIGNGDFAIGTGSGELMHLRSQGSELRFVGDDGDDRDAIEPPAAIRFARTERTDAIGTGATVCAARPSRAARKRRLAARVTAAEAA